MSLSRSIRLSVMWPALFGAGCLLSTTSRANTLTALVDGNWTAATTWSNGDVPAAGDVMIIPSGITVTITANLSYIGEPMRVQVYGTLFFNGGGAKLSLPCGSIVEIMTPTATMAGNSSGSSQTLRICNTTVWTVGANNNMHGYTDYPTDATLPVELLYFTGTTQAAAVQLRWATASEASSEYFELRRSQDGVGEVAIARVAAVGSSQQVSAYHLEDVPPGAGTWYYRLLQYDADGTANDEGSIAVQMMAAVELQCQPMPASTDLVIVSQDLPATLFLRDLEGRILMQAPLAGSQTTLSVDALPNGPYLVQAVSAGRVSSQRILVAH